MIIVQNFEDFNNVMAKIGFGQAQVFMVFTCGFFNMYLLCETMGISVISSAAMCELNLDAKQRSLLRTSCLAGLALGAYFMGYLSDQYGRRKVLLYSTPICLIISNVCWIFFNVWEWVTVMRFLLGIVLGGVASAIMPYLGEFCMSQKCLARIVSFMAMFAGLGMIYMPAMATIVFNQYIITYPAWRLLGIIYSLPGFLAFVLLLLLPESPRYLLAAGRYNDTTKVLVWLCLKNRGQTLQQIGIEDIDHLVAQIESDKKNWLYHMFNDGLPLFQKPLVHKFLGSFFIHFFIVCITRGLGLWFSEMRVRRFRFKANDNVCMEIVSFLEQEDKPAEVNCVFRNHASSIYLGVSFVIGYLVIAFLLKFMKPNVLFVSGLFLASSAGFILAWVPNSIVISVCFICLLLFPNIVMNLLGSNIVAFAPTHLRSRAMGLCDASGRVGAIVGCNILGFFLHDNCLLLFNIFAACPLIAAICGIFLPFGSESLITHTFRPD